MAQQDQGMRMLINDEEDEEDDEDDDDVDAADDGDDDDEDDEGVPAGNLLSGGGVSGGTWGGSNLGLPGGGL